MRPNRIQFRAEDSTNSLRQGNDLSFVHGDFEIAHGGGAADRGTANPALNLLFPVGLCPGRPAILRAIEAAEDLGLAIDGGEGGTLELVSRGLSFEVTGIARSAEESWQDRSTDSFPPGGMGRRYETIGLVAGPHMETGARTPAVLKRQSRAAIALGRQFPVLEGFSWSTARNTVVPSHFADLFERWDAGEALPAELFVTFRKDLDEGLSSLGLSLFTDQELRIEPDAAEAIPDAGRLAMRIAGQLIAMGPLSDPQDFATPDGRNLRLEASPNGRFVRAFLR